MTIKKKPFPIILGQKKMSLHDAEVRANAISDFTDDIVTEVTRLVLSATNNQTLVDLCRKNIYKSAEEYKEIVKTVEYKGFKARQALDGQVWLLKNGETVFLAQCFKTKTEEDLKKMIDNYVELIQDGDLSYINVKK